MELTTAPAWWMRTGAIFNAARIRICLGPSPDLGDATSPKLLLMDLWKALQGVAIKAARYFECRNSIRSWHLGLVHRLSARRMGFPRPDSSLSEAALLWQRR